MNKKWEKSISFFDLLHFSEDGCQNIELCTSYKLFSQVSDNIQSHWFVCLQITCTVCQKGSVISKAVFCFFLSLQEPVNSELNIVFTQAKLLHEIHVWKKKIWNEYDVGTFNRELFDCHFHWVHPFGIISPARRVTRWMETIQLYQFITGPMQRNKQQSSQI